MRWTVVKMKFEFKYILSAISVTSGSLIIYGTRLFPIGIILICLPGVFLSATKPHRLKWNATRFFECTTIILGLTVLIVLITQIPEEVGEELLRKCYFIGPLWLFGLSGLSYRYLKDKEQSQPRL